MTQILDAGFRATFLPGASWVWVSLSFLALGLGLGEQPPAPIGQEHGTESSGAQACFFLVTPRNETHAALWGMCWPC